MLYTLRSTVLLALPWKQSDKWSGIQPVTSPDFCFSLLPCVLTTTHFPTHSSAFRCPHHPKGPPCPQDLSLPAHSSTSLASPCIPNAFSLNAASSPRVSSVVLSAGRRAPRLWLIPSDRHTNWLTIARVFGGHRLRPSKTDDFNACLFIHRDSNFNLFLSVTQPLILIKPAET